MYGQALPEQDRPSRGKFTAPETKEIDSSQKQLFANSKVGLIIRYRPERRVLDLTVDVDDSKLLTCGASLFSSDSVYNHSVVVRYVKVPLKSSITVRIL